MTPFQTRHTFHNRLFLRLLSKPDEQFLTNALVRDFASAEANGHLDLRTVFQELEHVFQLDVEVVFVDVWRHANFLEKDDFLILARLFFFLALLVLELAEVHNPANRWLGVRRDVD